MKVRITCHNARLAACLKCFIDAGTLDAIESARAVSTLGSFLHGVEKSFNRRLPFEDLRTERIRQANQTEENFLTLFSTQKYDRNTTVFLQRIRVIETLAEFLPKAAGRDSHSYVCEIVGKTTQASALAIYFDPPKARAFVIWWLGTPDKIDRTVSELRKPTFDWSDLSPTYSKWLRTKGMRILS